MNNVKGRPICAKCGKPVERIERRDDYLSRVIVFTAFCHGETEKTTLALKDLLTFIPDAGIEFTEAFKQRATLREGK